MYEFMHILYMHYRNITYICYMYHLLHERHCEFQQQMKIRYFYRLALCFLAVRATPSDKS